MHFNGCIRGLRTGVRGMRPEGVPLPTSKGKAKEKRDIDNAFKQRR